MKNLCLAGRRRAELRGQRPDSARRAVREHLDSTGRRRRGRGAGRRRCSSGISCSTARDSRRPTDSQRGSLLGPDYSTTPKSASSSIRSGASTTQIDDDQQLCDHIADRIADGNVIGWFQGRDGIWPAGARLAQPARRPAQSRDADRDEREGEIPRGIPAVRAGGARGARTRVFRRRAGPGQPVHAAGGAGARGEAAPAHGRGSAAARASTSSRRMRSDVPAITHVDYSARIQTVDRERHGLYHGVIEAFYRKTGCPVIVNTSFNLGWDPIVCTPKEAYDTFMASDIDVLCLGHFVLTKSASGRSSLGRRPSQRADAVVADVWCSPDIRRSCELRASRSRGVRKSRPDVSDQPTAFRSCSGRTTTIASRSRRHRNREGVLRGNAVSRTTTITIRSVR